MPDNVYVVTNELLNVSSYFSFNFLRSLVFFDFPRVRPNTDIFMFELIQFPCVLSGPLCL